MVVYGTSPALAFILLIRNSGREVIILLFLDLKKYGEEKEELECKNHLSCALIIRV